MNNVICNYNNVSEHDMDLMFLQLFSSDEGFVRLFLDTVGIDDPSAKVESVELSKTDPKLGESDIVILLSVDNKKIALLIEDKIDAIAMPEQPERYIKRGKKAVSKGEYDEFYSFIVCTQKYYDEDKVAGKYPYMVSYECIRDYLSGNDSLLYSAYYQLIDQAICKSKSPRHVTLNEKANAFFRKYIEYKNSFYKDLDLRNKPDSNGYWAHYGTRLGEAYIYHKIQEGKVDLTFPGAAKKMAELGLVVEWLREHDHEDVRAEVTGKAGVIRFDVPPLNMELPFESSSEADVEICFDRISKLTDIANTFALAAKIATEK